MKIGILLAAGRSTRFGRDKRFECLPDTTPIALASALNLKAAVDRLFIAIHEDDQDFETLLHAAQLEFFVCTEASQGMGNSIGQISQQIVNKLGGEGVQAGQCLLALADMPFIHPNSYQLMVEALNQGASIVRPQYQGQSGHPVGFSAKWWPALQALEGEHGGRDLIAAHENECAYIPCDDAGVVMDVDYPDDLNSRY